MLKNIGIISLVAAVTYYMLPTCHEEFKPDMLQGKNVLVTGASSGIGEEMAYHLASMGANVFITARREEKLRQVISRCKEVGPTGNHYYMAADMTSQEQWQPLIESAVSRLGSIDYLFLNHAYLTPIDPWEGKPEDFKGLHYTMDTNFFSYVALASHAMPHLMASQGKMGVVSSINGKVPVAFAEKYCASKFSLDGFFASLRQEHKFTHTNVSITIHIIGAIETDRGVAVRHQGFEMLNINEAVILTALPPASASDTGYAIIRATALGWEELWYPSNQWLGALAFIRLLSPRLYESLMDFSNVQNS